MHSCVDRNDVIGQGRALAEKFVFERLRSEHIELVENVDELHTYSLPPSPAVDNIEPLVAHLQQVADELDNDPDIAGLVGRVPLDFEEMTLQRLTDHILTDVAVNWGRVFMLFYVTYRLIKRRIDQGIAVVRNILDWFTNCIRDRLANWVVLHGGWETAVDWCRSSGNALLTLSLACVSVLTIVLCNRLNS